MQIGEKKLSTSLKNELPVKKTVERQPETQIDTTEKVSLSADEKTEKPKDYASNALNEYAEENPQMADFMDSLEVPDRKVSSATIKKYLKSVKEFADRFVKMGNRERISKDGKFLGFTPDSRDFNYFATIPPAGNKLILCKIIKDNTGNKPCVTQTLDLETLTKSKEKPSYLSCTEERYNRFYLNYPSGDHLQSFLFDYSSAGYNVEYSGRLEMFNTLNGYNIAVK